MLSTSIESLHLVPTEQSTRKENKALIRKTGNPTTDRVILLPRLSDYRIDMSKDDQIMDRDFNETGPFHRNTNKINQKTRSICANNHLVSDHSCENSF